MKRKFLIALWIGLGIGVVPGWAQRLDPTPGQSLFTVRGYGHTGLEFRKFENKPWQNSFVGGSFNPIFLWRQSDRLLFEGELGVSFEAGEVEFDLEYANISYKLTNRLTARLGRFLLPFGIFSANLHPAWINRLPTAPPGFGHDNPVGPASDFGIELRGAVPLGGGRLTYAAYVVNGPALNDGEADPDAAGQLTYGLIEDNNANKAFGGRLSVLPLSDLSLEIGLSGQYARVGAAESAFEDVAARMYAIDLNLVRRLTFLKSMLNIKAQYNAVLVDRATYPGQEPGETVTFDNESWAYFVQASLQPSFASSNVLKRMEFVGRLSRLQLAPEAPWGEKRREIAFSLNYWLDWRTVIKFSYLVNDMLGEAPHEELAGMAKTPAGEEGEAGGVFKNAFMIHVAIGF